MRWCTLIAAATAFAPPPTRRLRVAPLQGGLNIDDGCNLMLMPNKVGARALRTTRPVHDGGHEGYNRFVGARLDEIFAQPTDQHQRYVEDLIRALRRRVRAGETPWW